MAMEFLLVKCPDDVEVLADGDPVGRTNRTMMLATGSYAITLARPDAYEPAEQDAVLVGTALTAPLEIAFTAARASIAPVARGPVGGARPAPVGTAAPAKRKPPVAAKKPATKQPATRKAPTKKPATKKVGRRATRKQSAP